MIEELWDNFREVFDYTFPEIQVLEVVDLGSGIFRLTAYFGAFQSMNITTELWGHMTEKARKLMMLGFCHKIFDTIEEIQNGTVTW